MSEKTAEERALSVSLDLSLTAFMNMQGPFPSDSVRSRVADEIRAAVQAEQKEWHGLISVMMKALPWGGLKGALLEDHRVKAAIRAEPDKKGANPIWGATARRVEPKGEGKDGS